MTKNVLEGLNLERAQRNIRFKSFRDGLCLSSFFSTPENIENFSREIARHSAEFESISRYSVNEALTLMAEIRDNIQKLITAISN